MKKQTNHTNYNLRGINSNKDQFSKSSKQEKPTRYIYTEEDLGEGILYAGLMSTYQASSAHENSGMKNNINVSRSFLYV